MCALRQCPDEIRLDHAVEDMHMAARDKFTFGEGLHIWRHFLDTKDDELTMLKRAFQVGTRPAGWPTLRVALCLNCPRFHPATILARCTATHTSGPRCEPVTTS